MTLSRRNALRLAALAGVAGATGALAACKRMSKTTSSPSSPAPTPTPTRASPRPSAPSTPAWGDLAKNIKGTVVRPTDASYRAVARLYNPRYDNAATPAAIARCVTDADVAACVRFAAGSRVPFAMRSGGHSYPGWSSSTGLVIDVSRMNQVVVDTAAKTARIAAGARLADVYAALAAKGMALAAGSCPTVGIAGLAMGGGVGVLTRAYGLTCDAVRVVDIVTADGQLRQASSAADSDLFWALRGGGGGSFGAATAFTVALRPAPAVNTFYYEWPMERAADVLAAWQTWIVNADRRLSTTCKLLCDPTSGTRRALIAGAWIGPAKDLDAQVKPLLGTLAKPVSTSVHAHSYAEAMLLEAGCRVTDDAAGCVASALTPAKRQAFAATSSILTAPLNELAVKTAVDNANAAMNVHGMIEGGVSFDALGGAVLDLDDNATAFAHRSAAAIVQYTATWDGTLPPTAFDMYVRSYRAAMGIWMGAGAYVNYADRTIVNYPDAYWPGAYPRVQQVKQRYDPAELFTFPQAVRPLSTGVR
jgi:FAD/FMN-containing dehydrogenase